jgi:hypothetical protein
MPVPVHVNGVSRAASSGHRAIAEKATNPTAVTIGRAGFAARGVVYLIVGWLSLLAAVGTGTAIDKQGAMQAIAQQSQGAILLGKVAVGLFAYAAWSLVRAAFDPDRQGHDAKGAFARIGYAIAGFTYGGTALAAWQLARGTGSDGQSSDASTQDWTARLLSAPFGPPLVIAAGVVLLAIAVSEWVKAYKASFRNELSLVSLRSDLQDWIVRVGRAGLTARGVVFAMTGVFLIQAARYQDPGQAVGLGGALQKLAEQSYGQLWLGLVAAGLCMYGLYSLVQARYGRLKR